MLRYMQELNNLDSRKGRRPLDLTNIIYWFKNARAAQRRATKTADNSFENEENVDVSDGGHSTPGLGGGGGGVGRGEGFGGERERGLSDTPSLIPPYLPNKNAVYIVPYPFHSSHLSTSSSSSSSSTNPLLSSTPDPLGSGGDSNDEPCDLSIKKLSEAPANQQSTPPQRATPTRKATESCLQENGELSVGGGRNSGSHSRKNSPMRNGYIKSSLDDDYMSAASLFNGHRSPAAKKRSRELERGRQMMLDKAFPNDHDERLVMDLKDDGDASDAESCRSNNDTEGEEEEREERERRMRMQEEEELELLARARAEMGLAGLSPLSVTSEASMAALSLAQMSQPQAMLSMAAQHHINPLAMYYNLAPRYYHPSHTAHHPASHHPHHHHHSSAAAMVAALSGQTHINGHGVSNSGGGGGNLHGNSSSSSSSNSQSPASRSAPIPPPSSHHSHPHAHGHSLSSSHHPSTPTSRGERSSGETRKRRTRVFIDPLTEIPRLEKWFQDDTHPSAYMIDKYTDTLNQAEYRQKFPKLEAKNIQLWFKNHRAKVKRQRVGGPGGKDSLSLCGSPSPGSRSHTPLNMVMSRDDPSTSSPDKHSSDGVGPGHGEDEDDEEEDMEDGEQ
jgi:homeobox domain-containing protein